MAEEKDWYKNRFGMGVGASALGFGSSVLGSLSGYSASKAQSRALEQNARGVRTQAGHDKEAGIAGELTQRRNQNNASGKARAAQAMSGFTDQGSGNQVEVDMMTQYEHAIAQAAVQRDNRYLSALDQADMMDWQARQSKRAAKSQLFGSLLGGAAQAGFGVAGVL